MRSTVIIEKGESGFGAYAPDFAGCIATGASRAEVLRLVREAIEFHIDDLREHGEPVSAPSSMIELVEVTVA